MLRAYVISGLIALATYGIAQYRGWSAFGSDAQEFQRARAEAVYRGGYGSGSRGFFTGGTSGHK